MKKILILGGDGYLGWPTAMHFAVKGFKVTVADNYYRRKIAEQTNSNPLITTPNLRASCQLISKSILTQILKFALVIWRILSLCLN